MDIRWQGLTELKRSLRELKIRLFPGAAKEIHVVAEKIRKDMGIPGSPPTYPIKWDSPKQQQAFFASNGFGGGIPTKRSNVSVEGWRVVRLENGANVGNPLSHAAWVFGTAKGKRQSRIHKGRWNLFRNVVDSAVEKLPKNIRDKIVVIARDVGLDAK
jgi:hypothetical protein